MATGREARRHRITDRGSDRFALITGCGLPSSLACPPTETSTADQENAFALSNKKHIGESSHPSRLDDQIEHRWPLSDRKLRILLSTAATFLNIKETFSETLSSDIISLNDNGRKAKNILSRAAILIGIEKEMSKIATSLTSRMQEYQRLEKSSLTRTCMFSRISAVITTKEIARIYCSAAYATLAIVLPSCVVDFVPLLYLLFLTNVFIVAAPIVLGAKQETRRRVKKGIEVGLMLQKILIALFMDFSMYVVLLIFELSIVRKLRW